jgi:uncharacterized protein
VSSASLRGARDAEILALLEQAGANAAVATSRLAKLLTAIPDDLGIASAILDDERAGDRLIHAILRRLDDPQQQFVDAADVHLLASAVDDIVDHAEEAADAIGRYGIEAPMENASELGRVLERSAAEVAAALSEFSRGENIASRIKQIHTLENEGDRVSREGIGTLFAGGIDPMVVIRWKDVYEFLERAVDACEGVANALDSLELRHGRR